MVALVEIRRIHVVLWVYCIVHMSAYDQVFMLALVCLPFLTVLYVRWYVDMYVL
jgi:hypothetical protein